MKRRAVVSFLSVALFLISVFPMNISSSASDSHSSYGPSGLVAQSTVDEWPMFHHDPTRNGYSTSTAPTTNQTLWSYTTGNYVFSSSPAVAGGIVYVGSWDGKVYALNATTGTRVWDYTTGRAVDSSPAVVGGVVFVGSDDDKVYALNATTGTQVWNYTTGSLVVSSPAVAGGVVYVGSEDDNVYALNATTGAFIWSYTTGDVVGSSPAVVDGVVYVGSCDDKVYAFGVHDVAVTNVAPSKTWVGQGFSVTINVTVANEGGYTEALSVTACANVTAIQTENVTLASQDSTTLTFTWNTTGFAYGNYTISAYVWPVPGETNTANNNMTDGYVLVTILGDMNGDGTVDIYDAITFANYFGLQKGDARWNPDADINRDGITDIYDAIIIAEHFGKNGSS